MAAISIKKLTFLRLMRLTDQNKWHIYPLGVNRCFAATDLRPSQKKILAVGDFE